MKLLLVTLYFPPAGGGGVQRPLKFASHLPAHGIETHVLAPDDPKWVHEDAELPLPTQAWVHRVRYVGPRGRRLADELHGRSGLDLAVRRASTIGRRLLLPDENVTWNATAIPKAISIVRSEGIDVVLTTSPPASVHLIGAAVKRATGVKWVADLRDSIVLHAHRSADGIGARAKQKARAGVAHLVARRADAIVTAAESITSEMRGLSPVGRLVTITNGCDFDDFVGLEHVHGDRFSITHAGSFFGKRDPKPFLRALAASGLEDVTVRFLGDFRPADREVVTELGLDDRVELVPHVPRRESLRLQRESDVLLLLIPEAGGRGRGVLSGKVFEYIAAERPILAVVPTDGAAAQLVRDANVGIVAAPEDVDAIRDALVDLHARWRAGSLDGAPL
jgi:glycosyltransferase involved in cell wall biosynthesis